MFVIYAYIDPSNHPNVGKYASPMECLGMSGIYIDSIRVNESKKHPETRDRAPRPRARGEKKKGTQPGSRPGSGVEAFG